MPDSMITSCPTTAKSEGARRSARASLNAADHRHHHHLLQDSIQEDVGNQSDSSNSNSSLISSPRYNERHPRIFEGVRRKRSSGVCAASSLGCSGGSSSRGSFVMLSSRTSLPPLDENNTLDATESQLALNLRRATRSTSWTNQKILDAIDGLNTCVEELDPCLALSGKAATLIEEKDARTTKNESPRRSSFEKFVLSKSISNLIMKSRSSGSVNPPTSNQKSESSCYNFLSGIREDEAEEQQLLQEDHHSTNGKHCTYCSCCGSSGGIRLTLTPATEPQDEMKRKRGVTGGAESPLREEHHDEYNDLLTPPKAVDIIGTQQQQQLTSQNGNVNKK